MNWTLRGKTKDLDAEDKLQLMEEIRIAHQIWDNAQESLNWVEGSEEVDYAIYALAAAEKKYEMLLRQAKRLDWYSPYRYAKEG